ncbi:MAG: hypothetical protein AAF614_10655 [Chloroflexota bacterium]
METPSPAFGYLDGVDNNRIFGWAMRSHTTDPVSVRLLLDNKPIATVKASSFRSDLVGLHPTGYCGFEVDMKTADFTLPDHGTVQAFVIDSEEELAGSPWLTYSSSYIEQAKQEIASRSFTEETVKVLILGLGKSGTSILTYRIAAPHPDMVVHFEPHTTLCLNHIAFHKEATAVNKVITKALYYPHQPEQLDLISRFYNKKICIVRDPRDLLISTFLYSWNRGDHPPADLFPQALKLVQAKEAQPRAVTMRSLLALRPEVERHILDASNTFSLVVADLGPEWLILKYEDFVSGNIAHLNDYLGYGIQAEATVPDNLNRVVRSKSFDNWRRWFTPGDVAHFQPQITPFLAQLGYDSADWQLTNVDSLPRAASSAYMTRIFNPPVKKQTSWEIVKGWFTEKIKAAG